jgi:hypothetical protein
MKNTIIILLSILSFTSYAQYNDKIYFTNGTTLDCKVIEMLPEHIGYIQANDQPPTYTHFIYLSGFIKSGTYYHTLINDKGNWLNISFTDTLTYQDNTYKVKTEQLLKLKPTNNTVINKRLKQGGVFLLLGGITYVISNIAIHVKENDPSQLNPNTHRNGKLIGNIINGSLFLIGGAIIIDGGIKHHQLKYKNKIYL